MRIDVLDSGFVELQDMMGDDLAIVNAARVSFLGDSKGTEADKKLLNYLMRERHTSPFEQVVFKFRINAPVLVWWQTARHRTARMNLQSGRYTELIEMYTPSEWRLQSTSDKQASEGLASKEDTMNLNIWLDKLYNLADYYYECALEMGIAREQARLFLPGFAMYYVGIWQIDAHNLMNFIRQRTSPHAQWEIRQYAEAIYTIFKAKLPWTAEAFEKYVLKVLKEG